MTLRTVPCCLTLLLAAGLAACDEPKPRAAAPPEKAASAAEPAPPPPAWATAQMNQLLNQVYPGKGTCIGNTDVVVAKYAGPPAGTKLLGWGWDPARKARVERVVLVDARYRIVGAGDGGVHRPDVPANSPEIPDPATGWHAMTPLTSGPVDAYGVLQDGKSVCPLGHIEIR